MAVKIEVKGPIVSNDTAWLYHYFGWDACSPKDISQKLTEAAGDEVILEINSPGGVCNYGYEMYTALMQYEGKVTAHVIMAASAASLLVCAADKALASDTCIFMIHNTQCSTSGDYRDMQESADALREFNAGIINAYVRKTGKSREELQALMDDETYMSPQTAIENGFIDDYIFGNPDKSNSGEDTSTVQNSMMLQVMNAAFPVISAEKAQEIMATIKIPQFQTGPAITEAQQTDVGIRHPDSKGVLEKDADLTDTQNNSDSTVSEINDNHSKEGEKRNMTLEEIYGEHPELKDEVNALVAGARNEGADEERDRLKSLDKIAASVTSDALEAAKYGDNRMSAKDLAYQTLMEDGQKAKNYMTNAMQDSTESGVDEVGAGVPEEETTDESDDMAAHVNAKAKGGKR